MKKLTIVLTLVLFAATFARDDKVMMPLARVLASNLFKEKLGTNVRFVFADTIIPPGGTALEVITTSRKTNKFGKADSTACDWVFLSAMIALKESAVKQGADAVVGIVSNYKHVVFSSDAEYECHVGGMVAGVALKGIPVKSGK